MTEKQTTLETFYTGWQSYQEQLVKAIAPLSAEQLALRAAPNLRMIGEIASHIVGTRAGWFHRGIGEGSDETTPFTQWRGAVVATLTAAELVQGLEATWRMLQSSLARWTPDELAQPFQRPWQGEEVTLTRQWIIWHLIEHDLHHGGELAFSLGMHGLAAPDL
jgi:uncharacterized damage-inducible protein DinB